MHGQRLRIGVDHFSGSRGALLTAALMVALGAGGLAGSSAIAAEGKDAKGAKEKSAAEAKPASELIQLVDKLGDGSFSVRESATEELIRQGLSSKPHLMAALDSSDAEVRFRARRILTVILQEDFTKRLQAFAADVDGRRGLTMPSWEAFSKAIGSDAECRELFVQMQESEPVLMEAYEKGPEAAAKSLDERIGSFQNSPVLLRRNVTIDTGSAAAFLFVGSDPEVKLPEDSIAKLTILPSRVAGPAAASGTMSKVRRRLLGRWVSRDVPPNYVVQNIWLGVQYDLKEALTPAINILKKEDSPASLRCPALVAVAKLGGTEHLPLVEKFLSDTTVCMTFGRNNKPITTLVRDVALVATIKLHGKEPRDFGFERLPSNAKQLSNWHSFGFETEEDRQAAFDKWAAAKSAALEPESKQATQKPAEASSQG